MAYSTLEGRQELLDGLAGAIDDIGFALAALGAAYEQLDEPTADRLEEQLFGPVVVGEVEIGPAVVVEVAGGGRERPARAARAQRVGHVLEVPVPDILE